MKYGIAVILCVIAVGCASRPKPAPVEGRELDGSGAQAKAQEQPGVDNGARPALAKVNVEPSGARVMAAPNPSHAAPIPLPEVGMTVTPLPGDRSSTEKPYQASAAVLELVRQARRQLVAERHVSAIATLERGIRIAPQDPMLWHELARAQLLAGAAERAKSVAERALAFSRGDLALLHANWLLIAEVEYLRGDAAAAAYASEQAARYGAARTRQP